LRRTSAHVDDPVPPSAAWGRPAVAIERWLVGDEAPLTTPWPIRRPSKNDCQTGCVSCAP
jgi:hypothetical protein